MAALGLCFFDKECIRKREEQQAQQNIAAQQQQQTLQLLLNKQTSGLSIGAIVGIVLLIIAITVGTIFFIRKNKK